ncbi:DUF2235 domain-containing protein [Streptomyces sp. MAI_2237]
MARRLVVCCDGTWNLADQPSKTNVTKVALAVLPSSADGTPQRVYYHSGVGTRRREHLRGGAFGVGLSHNVLSAYRFLVENFEPGDDVYLFGFSRGAFTARSLAGLINNSGILRRRNAHRTKEAWALYRSRIEKPNGAASTLFRRAYAHETDIHFIGVWDTVGALGIPVPGPPWLAPVVRLVNRRWAFHDTDLGPRVRVARHALAIDERREAFRPTLWNQRPEAAAGGQTLEQVWFTGVHCDVGGGERETGLSDIALLWMVEQARRAGLEFDAEAFSARGPAVMKPDRSIDFRVRADPMGPVHESRTGLYRLFRPLHRPIGHREDRQYVSATARRRYDDDPAYRESSPALARYLTEPTRLDIAQVPLTAAAAGLVPQRVPRPATPARSGSSSDVDH